jgi:hypothetical protein
MSEQIRFLTATGPTGYFRPGTAFRLQHGRGAWALPPPTGNRDDRLDR